MRITLPSGISLHVHIKDGSNPSTLLLHGWAVSSAVWEPVFARWPNRAGQVLAPDLRGTGWSSKPRDGYTLDDYVADVVGLIDTLALRDLALVGHSMGGTIAQRVALERPDALRRLILVSPVPASGVPFADDDLAFFRSLGGSREGAAQIISMMMTRRPPPKLLDRLVDMMASVAIEAYLGGFDAWRTASFADRVGAIAVPTLVFGGEAEQPLTPELLTSAVVEKIPGARFVAIPGTGHYPQIECADEFVTMLVDALEQPAT
jgi:non-heme chloroperoxidase